jgi:hypothetical protein
MGGFYDEREEIGELLESVLREYLADAGIPPVNDTCEEVCGRHAIGRFPSTREMRFYLNDLAAFTPELADRLRTRVLARFKRWTLVPQYVHEVFTVSAGGVSFGGKRLRAPFTEATEPYRRWLQEAREHDEQQKGPLRRQFRYLRPLLPEAVRMARKKVTVLAAFDRLVSPPAEGKPVVWVLAKGGDEKPRVRPGTGQKCYTVTAEGEIEPEYCFKYWPSTDVPSPFFLLAHEFSWRSRGRLELFLPRRGKTPEVVLGQVRVDRLTRDADLQARQPEPNPDGATRTRRSGVAPRTALSRARPRARS